MMINDTCSICITSFNSGGMGVDKQNYIKTLFLFSDVLCIQEHFLLNSGGKKHNNTHKLKQYFGDDYDMVINPASKSNLNITRGRGSGGLALLWRKNLTKYVSNIKSDNYRIQAVKFKFPEAELLVANLYFMVDPQVQNFDDTGLLETLAELERVIDVSECKNILLAGDINCDFARNTRFVDIVKDFINQRGLCVFWTMPDNDNSHRIEEVKQTYSNTINGINYSSVIDHFIGNQRMYNAVTEAGVIDDPNNHSGHNPIYTKFNVNRLNLELEEQVRIPKPSWNKATQIEKEEFKLSLDQSLFNTLPPEPCQTCDTLACEVHDVEVDEYATSICEALDTAARDCLPLVGGADERGRRGIPGWTDYVKPYQDESMFWHGVWCAAGSPDYGELYRLKRESKMQYKYAIRRLKRASYNIQKDKLLSGFLNGGVNIFKEIKKSRGGTCTTSNSVDGHIGAANISDHFAEVYKDLYQRHNLENGYDEWRERIDSQINEDLLYDLDRVNEHTVRAALNKLKTGKSDPTFSFSSDCLLNGGDLLVNRVTSLFKWFLRTGRIPPILLLCTIIPIVKDNLGDVTASDNYRAIAIGSLILKWFDWLILILEEDKLSTDELQFGFKPNSSTSMCSWAITTVINYYNNAGRPIFACSMDLSKAFDLVAWNKLFPELIDRGVSPLILRCLINIYVNQMCNVRWGNTHSQRFQVLNGVRQGAVSSPILFCIYINKLIILLRSANVGCQLQGIFLGIWVYADDIILMSPSRAGLQLMTNICENFASDNYLKFSTNIDVAKSKTKCIIFSNPVISVNDIHPIILNGLPLPYVSEVKHLGNILQCNNSMSKDCALKRAQFISKVHSLNQEFHYADPCTVVKLYNIYALSFYGSNLWNLNSEDCHRIYKSWNVAIRILFDVPRDTHRYFIETISNVLHVKTALCSRFVQFYDRLRNCSKLSIRLLVNLSKGDHRTFICSNLTNIARECNTEIMSLCKNYVKSNLKFADVPDDQQWKVPILVELLNVRSNNLMINDFANRETTDMINFLCSN